MLSIRSCSHLLWFEGSFFRVWSVIATLNRGFSCMQSLKLWGFMYFGLIVVFIFIQSFLTYLRLFIFILFLAVLSLFMPPVSFASASVFIASLLLQLHYQKNTFNDFCQNVPLIRLYEMDSALVNFTHKKPEIHVSSLQNIIRKSYFQFSLFVSFLIHCEPFGDSFSKSKLEILNKILKINKIC